MLNQQLAYLLFLLILKQGQLVVMAVKNRFAPPSSQPPGVYEGPSMPDLRKDDDLDRVATRVLEFLEQKIPQIRLLNKFVHILKSKMWQISSKPARKLKLKILTFGRNKLIGSFKRRI